MACATLLSLGGVVRMRQNTLPVDSLRASGAFLTHEDGTPLCQMGLLLHTCPTNELRALLLALGAMEI